MAVPKPTTLVTATLCVFGVASAMLWAAAAAAETEVPQIIELLHPYTLSMLLAAWAMADARMTRRPLCYDFGAFVFFAWPIVLPCYLFYTRGIRGLVPLLGLAGIYVAGLLIGWLIYLLLIQFQTS